MALMVLSGLRVLQALMALMVLSGLQVLQALMALMVLPGLLVQKVRLDLRSSPSPRRRSLARCPWTTL